MPLLNESLIDSVNKMTESIGVFSQIADPLMLNGEEGLLVSGISTIPILITLPLWQVEEWRRGFGGWRIHRGKSVGFVRQRLSHPNLRAVVSLLNEIAAEKGPDGNRIDVRTKEMEEMVQKALPFKDFYFQDFNAQLAEAIADSMMGLIAGRSTESQARAATAVKSDISKYLNSFMRVQGKMNPKAMEKLKGAQFKVTLGYPRGGVPIGTAGFFRDWMATFLAERTDAVESALEAGEDTSELGLKNVWGDGPFTTSLTCTSKGEPGDWVTMIPPMVYRDTPTGRVAVHISTPVMMAAQAAIGYNRKRIFREGNGWFNSEPLANRRPLTHCLKNGFEYAAGEDLDNRRTELVTLFAQVTGVNVYESDEVGHEGEELNLDDILVTVIGAEASRSAIRFREEMDAGEWQIRAEEFVQPTGIMKPGFSLDPNLVRATSIKGRDVYSMQPTVYYPPSPDNDTIFKLLVEGSHKAMVKTVTTHLCGKDARGNVFPIDLIVSGDSVKDKKIPYMPLAGIAGRAGIQYWEDFENPVHVDRSKFVYDDSLRISRRKQYLAWAEQYDDLVRATARKLKGQGEDPEGLVSIYAWEPSPEDTVDDPHTVDPHSESIHNHWVFLKEAAVGYCRASRLWENERSSSKSKMEKAVPKSPFMNFLGDDQAKPTDLEKATLAIIIASYKNFPESEILTESEMGERDEDYAF